MANSGSSFGLHRTCRLKAQEKFDLNAAKEALKWIESVNGQRLGDTDVNTLTNERDVAELIKDGTALCEVMNHIQPGVIKKYHKSPKPFQQMENVELFLRACVDYGMEIIDTFQVKELYEARAVYTVINCIYALGSLAQQNGYTGPKLGVKIAQRNERHFSEEQMAQGRRTMSRQHISLPDSPSQAKMTPYGLCRQITLSETAANEVNLASHGVIGLQYGSNQVASRAGMTDYGMPRQTVPSTSSDGDHHHHLNDDNNPLTPTSPTSDNVFQTSPTLSSENETVKKSKIPTLAKINTKGENSNSHTTTIGIQVSPPLSPTTKAPSLGSSSTPGTPSKIVPNNPILKSDSSAPRPQRQFSSPSSSVIGLQYGTNKRASQAGMTAYGSPRQIVASRTSSSSMEGVDGVGVKEGGEVFDGLNHN